MTIDEWCKKNEISIHIYHYRNHQISEILKPDKEVTFAEITPIL